MTVSAKELYWDAVSCTEIQRRLSSKTHLLIQPNKAGIPDLVRPQHSKTQRMLAKYQWQTLREEWWNYGSWYVYQPHVELGFAGWTQGSLQLVVEDDLVGRKGCFETERSWLEVSALFQGLIYLLKPHCEWRRELVEAPVGKDVEKFNIGWLPKMKWRRWSTALMKSIFETAILSKIIIEGDDSD